MAQGLVGEASTRCGHVGALTPRLHGCLRRDWPLRGHGTSARPGQMEHAPELEKSEERELREKQRRHHGSVPPTWGVVSGFGAATMMRSQEGHGPVQRDGYVVH